MRLPHACRILVQAPLHRVLLRFQLLRRGRGAGCRRGFGARDDPIGRREPIEGAIRWSGGSRRCGGWRLSAAGLRAPGGIRERVCR